MKTAVYLRVSTEEQAKEGFSIPAQKERLTQFVNSQDWDIYDYYVEDGKSAKNTNRPELQRMLQDVKMGAIDIVLVYKLDRLTRSVLDLYKLLQEFEKYNVKFKSATEVYDTTTAIGRLFITLVAALAQWERENLGERVRMGMEEMVHQQKRPGGTAPLGFEIINKSLVVNEQEGMMIRYIFNRYLNGVGMNRIAVECNQMGWKTKRHCDFNRNGIYDILNNPAYCGTLRWNYKDYTTKKINPSEDWILIENVYPAIVSKEEFQRVKEMIQRKKGVHPRQLSSSSEYIFSSVMYCSRCGGKMVGHTMKWKERDYTLRQYMCKNIKVKKCNAPNVPLQLVEDAFIEELDRVIEHYSSIAMTVNRKPTEKKIKKKESLEQELKKISEKRKRFQIAFSEGLIEIEELKARIVDLQNQEEIIKSELHAWEKPHPSLSKEERLHIVLKTRKVWEHATTEEKKQMVHFLVKNIVVDIPDDQRKKRKNKKVVIHSLDFH